MTAYVNYDLLMPKLSGEVAKALRSVRRAAIAVEHAARHDRTKVQILIGDVVTAGTRLAEATNALERARIASRDQNA